MRRNPFDPKLLTMKPANGAWLVTDGRQTLASFAKEDDAKTAIKVMQYYGFNCQCETGGCTTSRKTTEPLAASRESTAKPQAACGPYNSCMKSHTEYLTFNVPSKMAFVNITPQVEEAVRKSGVQEGLVLVQRDAHHRQRLHQRRRARPAPRLRQVAGAAGPVQPRPATTTTTTAPARTTPTPT